jgi:hypothetical protein
MKTTTNRLLAHVLFAILLATSGCEQISPFINDEMFNRRLDLDGDGVPNAQDCAPGDPKITTLNFWHDLDGDGFGAGEMIKDCALKAGLSDKAGDCSDGNKQIFPGASEICNILDDNCNNSVDEGFTSHWCRDKDQDGFGNPDDCKDDCGVPSGYIGNALDCNDEVASVKPGVEDVCDNAIDENCDGKIDNAPQATKWFADADGDGTGNPAVSLYSCKVRTGYVIVTGDCNDANPSVSPGAPEACEDMIDNDCDGATDTDANEVDWYQDKDSDGFGDAKVAKTACKPPVGFVGNDIDCDDTKNAVKPGVDEVCNNGIDDNCDEDVNKCAFAPMSLPSSSDVIIQSNVNQAQAGLALANVGDVNNDTKDDFAVGSPGAVGGAVHLFFGPMNVGTTNLLTANVNFTPEAETGRAGWSIAGVGDINHDMVDDMAISADEHNGGTVYIFFGPIMPGTKSLSSANAILTAENGTNHVGWSLAGVGDINNDLIDDLAVGAVTVSEEAGAVYVLFGPIAPGIKSLSTASAKFTGETAGDIAGWSVASVGDINNDTFRDVAVGAINASNKAGITYILFGPITPGIKSLSTASAKFTGEADGHRSGWSIAGVGDINNDTINDLAVGAPNSPEDPGVSSAYIFFGPITPGTKSLSTASVKFTVETEGDNVGWSIAGVGDVNHDTFNDLAIGAPRTSVNGALYVLFGPISPGLKNLSNANVKFPGQNSHDRMGHTVMLGDWNGDGITDLGIGAPNNNGNTGTVYLKFGLSL